MIKVLSVADPAVLTYADPKKNILAPWMEKTNEEVEFTILPWAEYFPALMKALQAGEAGNRSDYDIVMIAGHLWLRDFANRGYLRALDGVREAVDAYAPYDDILLKIREEIEIDGTSWLIPSFTDGHIVYYKKDVITRVTGKELPQTLSPSEYLEVVRKIGSHEMGKKMNFLAMKAHESEIFLDWLPFYYETGGTLFDREMNPRFNTPAGVEALNNYLALKEYARSGSETAGNEEVLAALQADDCFIGVSWGGQAGFIVNEPILSKKNMGYATFTTPWNVSWSFGVPSGADYDDRIRDFLAYLVSPEVDALIGAGAGSPVRDSSYKSGTSGQPWYPTQRKMVTLAAPLPGFTGSGDIYGIFYKWIARAYAGEESPERVMAEMEREVTGELEKIR